MGVPSTEPRETNWDVLVGEKGADWFVSPIGKQKKNKSRPKGASQRSIQKGRHSERKIERTLRQSQRPALPKEKYN